MFGKREFHLGRYDRALPDCREVAPRRLRAVQQALAVAALLLASFGPRYETRAQAPGPESFAQEPKTPLELWSAVDYLMRTDQAGKAVPYLEKFLKSSAKDESLIEIRDKFGIGSVLRLGDDPATAKYAQPIADKLLTAARRYATQPERLRRFVAALTQTPAERSYAIARLREAGPVAVQLVIEALNRPGLTPEDHSLLSHGLGRLDRTAVPPLLAVLDSGNPRLAADAASALGMIGDPRAVSFLIYPAVAADVPAEVREAARAAVSRLTGKPFQLTAAAAAQKLAEDAWRFHRHQVEFPGDPVLIWSWNKDQNAPASRSMRERDAESELGLHLANQAIKLEPQNADAQAVHLSLSLQKAIERVGFKNFPAQDQAVHDVAKKAGPAVLSEVLRKAVADGKDELAAATATILGEVTDASALSRGGRPHALVDALSSPGARVQFAAARALVNMAPTKPFPGSSRVVPALSRFVTAQSPPRAVVIDGNSARGSQLVGSLHALGYEAILEPRGDLGFRAAAETADVELVLVTYALDRGRTWGLTDTLANLRSDARTADLPVYVYGPLDLQVNRPNLPLDFPGVKLLIQPMSPEILERELGGRPSRFTGEERAQSAQQATELLARIARQPGSPFEPDLKAAEPALMTALSQPATSMAASTALGDVPDANAQRSLADVVLDPSRPVELRRNCASQLSRSIKRFGPLVSADQEVRLAATLGIETDPQLRSTLEKTVAALRSWSQSNREVSLGTRAPEPGGTSPASGDSGSSSR